MADQATIELRRVVVQFLGAVKQVAESGTPEQIEQVRAMVADGMMDEVMRLRAEGYAPSLPAMGGIGYRQLAAAADGRMPIDEAVRLMIRDTTRYAKRQLTWFARDPEIRWLDVDAAGGVGGAARAVLELVEKEELVR